MRKQSLKTAIRLAHEGSNNIARAALVLNGCPIGGWGDTQQARIEIENYFLPHRTDRTYSCDEFIAAMYTVEHDRYRSILLADKTMAEG